MAIILDKVEYKVNHTVVPGGGVKVNWQLGYVWGGWVVEWVSDGERTSRVNRKCVLCRVDLKERYSRRWLAPELCESS